MKYFRLILLIVVTIGLVACTNNKSEQLILVNESGDVSSPMGQSLIRLAQIISDESQGSLTAKVFHRGELGGQQELFDHLMKGNIDILLSWPSTSYDTRLGTIYMPYLVLDWHDALAAYGENGWLKKDLDPVFADNGLKFFGPYPEGFGGIATRDRFATNHADAAGIKVRSQPIFPLPQSVQALGFEAVPIDWNEVYTAIQTGVVDGDSSNVIYWDYEYFGDLLDYFVHTRHNFSAFMLMMNQSSYDQLKPQHQRIVADAAATIIAEQFGAAQREDQKWIAAAQASGMQYIVPSVTEQQQWVKRVRQEVWPMSAANIGEKLMQSIQQNASVPSGEQQ